MGSITNRTISIGEQTLTYTLERKQVKNLNLHVRNDGSVYVSANPCVPVKQVDEFLISKAQFILNAQMRFREQATYKPQPKQYTSGETFYILGRALRLKVSQTTKDDVYDISEIVCRCVTVEGKRIWATVDIWEYPGGSSIEEHNEPQFYSKSNPKRIVGSVTTAKKVMDELAGEIGNVFVLDVSERINK